MLLFLLVLFPTIWIIPSSLLLLLWLTEDRLVCPFPPTLPLSQWQTLRNSVGKTIEAFHGAQTASPWAKHFKTITLKIPSHNWREGKSIHALLLIQTIIKQAHCLKNGRHHVTDAAVFTTPFCQCFCLLAVCKHHRRQMQKPAQGRTLGKIRLAYMWISFSNPKSPLEMNPGKAVSPHQNERMEQQKPPFQGLHMRAPGPVQRIVVWKTHFWRLNTKQVLLWAFMPHLSVLKQTSRPGLLEGAD